MKFHKTTPIKPFVGRQRELQRLKDICNRKEASVIVVHGRRRVGKTELIEYFFHNAPLLKFEGIQTLPQRSNYKAGLAKQIKACVKRLGYYTEQQELFEKINCSDWTSFFEILTPIVEKEEVILYFEEVQWLASYKDDFFAEMKPFWMIDGDIIKNCGWFFLALPPHL